MLEINSMSSAAIPYMLAAVGGYALTSALLLKYPNLLHKKKKQYFHCAHISHRGGAAENLENTITAYHHAINLGTDMLELDVNLSKDKQVVVSHDGDLIRTTGHQGKILDFEYKDLPPLKNNLKVTFYKSVVCLHKGETQKMPKLEDVFKQFPLVPINLDIKEENDELNQKCHELIKKFNREKLTVWGSHRNSTAQKLYKMNPDIPIFFSMKRVLLVYVWFYLGLLPFIPLKETHFEVLLPEVSNHTDFSHQRIAFLKWFGSLFKSKVLINHLRKRGISTYLWVLNEEEEFKIAFDLGVEGVMTDYPTKLTEWLNHHPQYRSQS